jgi:hypothetical protein
MLYICAITVDVYLGNCWKLTKSEVELSHKLVTFLPTLEGRKVGTLFLRGLGFLIRNATQTSGNIK